MHTLHEISPTQYQKIKTLLKANPDLIPVLPNYVNSKCEVTTANYEILADLTSQDDLKRFIATLPIIKSQSQQENKNKWIQTH